MTKNTFWSTVGRLLIGAACVMPAVSCGSEMLRTGRSPVYLVVVGIVAQNGATQDSESILHADVLTFVEVSIGGVTTRVPTIFSDGGTATIRAVAKNQTIETSPINAVTLTRYRVNFRRSDGRNTPGVDVPYGFDGGVSVTIDPGGSAEVPFELVRHQNKMEPPLRNLVGSSASSVAGLGFISTIAEVTFFGHDQNGNAVTVTGNISVQFADFGDRT